MAEGVRGSALYCLGLVVIGPYGEILLECLSPPWLSEVSQVEFLLHFSQLQSYPGAVIGLHLLGLR